MDNRAAGALLHNTSRLATGLRKAGAQIAAAWPRSGFCAGPEGGVAQRGVENASLPWIVIASICLLAAGQVEHSRR